MAISALENHTSATGVLEAFALRGGDGLGQAGLEFVVELLATRLHVEDLRQLARCFCRCVSMRNGSSRVPSAPTEVVLAFAVGGQQVGRDLQFMKLLAGAHHALRADHPFQLHGHQFRAFADHRFEARLVIGQAFDLVVLRLVLGQHVVEPQRGADHFIAQAHGIEHFGAGLADGHGARRGVLEGQACCRSFRPSAGRQSVPPGPGRTRLRPVMQGSNAGQQHGAISVGTVRGAGEYGLETHPRTRSGKLRKAGHQKKSTARMSFPDTPPVSDVAGPAGLLTDASSPRLRPSRA